ncbi:MAG: glycosyltransferase family 2 protein [Limisphaerales bacterium]
MLFSIVIPTYNRLSLLQEALDSVWLQKFTDYEVIVVDDGSTDRTWEDLQKLGSRVHARRQQNAGPGAARNLGAKHATGEYFAFLDSDDLWFPWTLKTYQQLIGQYQRPAFLAGKPLRFREENVMRAIVSSEPQAVLFPDYLASGDEWRWWGVSSFVVRRDAFEAVGGFTNKWVNGEDADLALRLGTARGFVQVTNPATFAYREHDSNTMKNLPKTLGGIWLGIRTEQAGQYPGGAPRARERWRILTRHVRPVTFDCLRHRLHKEAWQLYRAVFRRHVALGRWKYLAGFPMKALIGRSK